MSDPKPNRPAPSPDSGDEPGADDEPEYGARPVRSNIQVVVRVALALLVLALLVLAVWALLR